MDRVLGIDVGGYSVKLVVMRIDEHNCTVENYFEQKIQYVPDKDENICKLEAIKEALNSHQLHFNSAYAALSCDLTIAKRFEFYKLKRRDRQMVLENEFDSLGLFPMEEYALEYHTIDYKSEKTPLLGVLFKKQDLRDFIFILSSADLEPRTIDIDNMVYLNILQFLHQDIKKTEVLPEELQEGTVVIPDLPDLVVNIGHQKTSLTVIGNHKVLMARVLNTAGKYFTTSLQKALNLSFEEAEQTKHKLGQSADDTTSSDGSEILRNCYQDLALEIKRTIQSFSATGSIDIGRILLTGSSSLYHDTLDIFKDVIGIHTEKMEPQGAHFHVGDVANQPFHAETFAQSIAIGLRGSYDKNNSTMNLRHGEFSTTTNYDRVVEQIFLYAKIVAIIFVCLLGTYLFRYFSYDGKIKKMQIDYKKEINILFNGEPSELKIISREKNWDFHDYSLHAAKLLQENIEGKKKLIRDLNANENPLSIQVLNDISVAISKDIYFEVSEFKLTDRNLYIEADTDSTKALDQILSDFKKIKTFSKVEKKSQENKAGTGGQIIHFVLTAVVAE